MLGLKKLDHSWYTHFILPLFLQVLVHLCDASGLAQSTNLHHFGSGMRVGQNTEQCKSISGFVQSNNLHQLGSSETGSYFAHVIGQNVNDFGFEQSMTLQ